MEHLNGYGSEGYTWREHHKDVWTWIFISGHAGIPCSLYFYSLCVCFDILKLTINCLLMTTFAYVRVRGIYKCASCSWIFTKITFWKLLLKFWWFVRYREALKWYRLLIMGSSKNWAKISIVINKLAKFLIFQKYYHSYFPEISLALLDFDS